MSFSRETLDAIRARVSIAHLLAEQGVTLRRSGSNRVGLCPFHEERTPSLTWFPDDHVHCYGCQWHAKDLFAFVMRRDGCTFPQAVELLAARAGLLLRGSDQGRTAHATRPRPTTASGAGEPDFTGFAVSRAQSCTPEELQVHAAAMAVPVHVLSNLGCFAAKRMSRKHAIYPDAIGVLPLLAPMRRSIHGPVRGLRTRVVSPLPGRGRYGAVPGSRSALFIPDGLASDGTLWLAEGFSDTCALLSLGLTAAGRPAADAGDLLVLDIRRLAHARDVVLLGDNDEKPDGSWPGRASVDRLASALVGRVCRLRALFPPTGCKDMRDWIAAGATREDIEARLATHAVEHVPVITGARR